MDRIALTRQYLDEVGRSGASPAELLGRLPRTPILSTFHTKGRYLSRPVFIGHADRDRLHADVDTVRGVLASLPARLFGGDLGAFARAVGASDYQVSAVLRGRGGRDIPATRQARADMYLAESGFRLLEFNIGSALGGMQCQDMCRALLEHPVLARFAREHRLGYVDTTREQVHDTLAETGFAAGSFPVVAVTDWPSSYRDKLGPYMGHLADRWRELGLDAHPCHVGELEYRGSRVWLRGQAVDIVARMFMMEYLLRPEAPGLMDPLLDAVARGEVAMFAPLDGHLFASKVALAMVSDDRNRHLFSAAELASIDRILPWTRMLRPGLVRLEDGRTTDLMDYAMAHPGELVLKPAMRYGGQGVVAGWQHGLTRQRWRDELAAACGGSYVLQRRVAPVPEPFPVGPGEQAPFIVTWGVFTVVNGHGGIDTRAVSVASGAEVINSVSGAAVGCCLSTRPG